VAVRTVEADYPAAPRYASAGFFRTGQPADIVLSAIGFDDSGGGLLFNHPAGIAGDGDRLLVADRNNNRVLVWHEAPEGSTPPDLVLGQPDARRNDPGAGPHQMNWPSAVSAAGGRVAVADTENHRFLLWRAFPTASAQPADVVIDLRDLSRALGVGNLEWPWGVWTDGTRLVGVSTHPTAAILIWNTFPERPGARPDVVVRNPSMGTPRNFTSDGRMLAVWDHNARLPGGRGGRGTFIWRQMPATGDTPFDVLLPYQAIGAVLPDGRLLAAGDGLMLWNAIPTDPASRPDLTVRGANVGSQDGLGVALAAGRIYVLDGNGNKVLGYRAVPTRPDQAPDFVVGSSALCANTLDENFIMTNPVPATDGRSLFVSSDFDAKLYVWKDIPDKSNAYPDWVYDLPVPAWDNALAGETFVLAGKRGVIVWDRLPLDGRLPDRAFDGHIGSVVFQDLSGVALDDRYFYLADGAAGKIYVWRGLPEADSEPVRVIDVGTAIGRLDSDGRYLTAVGGGAGGPLVRVWRVADIAAGGEAREVRGGRGWRMNLPGGAMTIGERLLVADTVFGRVLGWDTIDAAVAGDAPALVLGDTRLDDTVPEIGRDKLFWPAAMAFDGTYLWVGEFKFSVRLLRYGLPEAVGTPGAAGTWRVAVPWVGKE